MAPVVDDVQTEVEVVTGTGLDTDQKELEDAFDAFENTEQPSPPCFDRIGVCKT